MWRARGEAGSLGLIVLQVWNEGSQSCNQGTLGCVGADVAVNLVHHTRASDVDAATTGFNRVVADGAAGHGIPENVVTAALIPIGFPAEGARYG